jgi:hypothetical protein
MWLFVIILASLWFFEIWPFSFGGPLGPRIEYIAEVGYRSGERIEWQIGSRRRSVDECRNEVNAIVNTISRADRRVTSTACRVMHGDRFVSRTR